MYDNAMVNPNIININEIVVLCGCDDIAHSSSTLTIVHDHNEVCKSLLGKDLLTLSITDAGETSLNYE